jgi:hypothetical protein
VLWALSLRAELGHCLEYGRADTSAAFWGGHDDFLPTVYDDAGFHQHCRRFDESQNQQLIVKVHTGVAIDELPTLSRNSFRVVRAVVHTLHHQCGAQQLRKGEAFFEMPVLSGDEK